MIISARFWWLSFILLTLPLAGQELPNVAMVTSVADSGPGTLRQAILDANSGACASPCTIGFFFSPAPGEEPRIQPLTPLPNIEADGLTIEGVGGPLRNPAVALDGSLAGTSSGLRLVGATNVRVGGMTIVNFSGHGIFIDGGSDNVVTDCSIGYTGPYRGEAVPAPNGLDGVAIRGGSGHSVGSSVIAGNEGNGIYATDTADLLIGGMNIGLVATETSEAIGNEGHGIFIQNVSSGQLQNSEITANGTTGISITGDDSRFEVGILNEIFGNDGLSIDLGFDGGTPNDPGDLDEGPNSLQNYPEITSATRNNDVITVRGFVDTTPSTQLILSIYSGSPGALGLVDAEHWVDFLSLQTDESGRADFEYSSRRTGEFERSHVTAMVEAFRDPLGQSVSSELNPGVELIESDVVYRVTTTANSGEGSLRQAILDLESDGCSSFDPCRVDFDLPEPVPAAGYYTIAVSSPLPEITHAGVIIDGHSQTLRTGDTNPRGPEVEIHGGMTTQGPGLAVRAVAGVLDYTFIRSLVINGFRGDGLRFTAEDVPEVRFELVRVDGCFVGVDPTATRVVPNAGSGIVIDGGWLLLGQVFDNRITGPGAGVDDRLPQPNVIGGSGRHGIELRRGRLNGSRNNIGTDLDGVIPLPNRGDGVYSAGGGAVGGGTIAFNLGNGVYAERGTLFSVRPDSIRRNGLLGIDNAEPGVGQGGDVPIAPVVTEAIVSTSTETRIVASLDVPPPDVTWIGYGVDFFENIFPDPSGRGEGEAVVGRVEADLDDNGHAEIELVVDEDLSGKWVTATSTLVDFFSGQTGSTSELSPAFFVRQPGCPAPPALVSPATGAQLPEGPIEFRWGTVPGASAYTLWLTRAGSEPHQAGESFVTEITVELDPGKYEWHVESDVPGCRSFVSGGGRFAVVGERSRLVRRP